MRFPLNVRDASPQSVQNFLITQRTYLEPEVRKIRYPGVTYSRIIPVDTSAPEWTPTVGVQSVDERGELQFLGPNSNDLNAADVGYGFGTLPINSAAIGYRYSLEELQQALLLQQNLSVDKASAARRIAEQGLNKLAYLGKAGTQYEGLLNNSGVPVVSAPGTLASLIAAATDVAGAQAVVTFFQTNINRVFVTQTNTTYYPTHVLIPHAQRAALASAILPFGGNMTLLNYLEANLDAGNGQRVEIFGELSLSGAGAGGVDRMMVYTRDMEAVKFHLPMPFNFMEPWHESPTTWFIPGMLRTGGTEIRVPKAHLYVDGV